jgi:enoyl-CoA hydratase/carnithine racemase
MNLRRSDDGVCAVDDRSTAQGTMEDLLRLSILDPARGRRVTPGLVTRLRTELDADRTSRVVVVEGGSGEFCEGLDLQTIGGELAAGGEPGAEQTLDGFRKLLLELRTTPRPVLAVVDGAAMGGGVGLAAVADIVIASRRATFALPETLFGLIPAVIFPYLAERIGVARARAMALAGETVTAEQAARWGLVDQLCDDLEGTVAKLRRRLCRQDPAAQAEIKRLVERYYGQPDPYGEDAVSTFTGLLRSRSTTERLERFAAGGTPWPDSSAP